MPKRQVEVTAGCPICEPAVRLVEELACPDCEVTVYDLRRSGADRAVEGGGELRIGVHQAQGGVLVSGLDEPAHRRALPGHGRQFGQGGVVVASDSPLSSSSARASSHPRRSRQVKARSPSMTALMPWSSM